MAFREAHGIYNDSSYNTYKDLYLGDYFKIQDGTYNATWMVAHFDYYWNKGNDDNLFDNRGVVLIPRTLCSVHKMKDTDIGTTGAYKASLAHTTICPAIATALQTVLGSYLLSPHKMITNNMSNNIPSMAGLGWNGASSYFEWVDNNCILPNEMQIFGSPINSSSFYDVGEANQKLAVFNFINTVEYARASFWVRDVVDQLSYGLISNYGNVSAYDATGSFGTRPLIYIG